MKAITYTKYGGLEALHLKEVEVPVSKDDEVLVKNYAVSINDWSRIVYFKWENKQIIVCRSLDLTPYKKGLICMLTKDNNHQFRGTNSFNCFVRNCYLLR